MTPFRPGKTRCAWLVGAMAAVLLAGSGGTARAEVPVPLLNALGLARPTERMVAPAFALPRLEGPSVSLVALRGRPVLLYFWATW